MAVDPFEMLFPAQRQFGEFSIARIEPSAVGRTRCRAEIFIEERVVRAADHERAVDKSGPRSDQSRQETVFIVSLVEERHKRQPFQRDQRLGRGRSRSIADERERPHTAALGEITSGGDLPPPALENLRNADIARRTTMRGRRASTILLLSTQWANSDSLVQRPHLRALTRMLLERRCDNRANSPVT